MKHLFFLGLILLALGSCKKDNNDNHDPETGNYYVKYKINGKQIAHEGEWQLNSGYGVTAEKVPIGIGPLDSKKIVVTGRSNEANEVCQLTIVSDSVKTGETYILDNQGVYGLAVISTNSKNYEILGWSNAPPYLMTIHIDKHSGGWITGTFSGKLGRYVTSNPPGSFEDAIITEGTFSSKVVYR